MKKLLFILLLIPILAISQKPFFGGAISTTILPVNDIQETVIFNLTAIIDNATITAGISKDATLFNLGYLFQVNNGKGYINPYLGHFFMKQPEIHRMRLNAGCNYLFMFKKCYLMFGIGTNEYFKIGIGIKL